MIPVPLHDACSMAVSVNRHGNDTVVIASPQSGFVVSSGVSVDDWKNALFGPVEESKNLRVSDIHFTSHDTVLVCLQDWSRGTAVVREVSMSGLFVRELQLESSLFKVVKGFFLGVEGAFTAIRDTLMHKTTAKNSLKPERVCVRGNVVAVGMSGGSGPRIILLEYESGNLMRKFGDIGSAPGNLPNVCGKLCINEDGSQVFVANGYRGVSVFSVNGDFKSELLNDTVFWRNITDIACWQERLIVADAARLEVVVLSLPLGTIEKVIGGLGSATANSLFTSIASIAVSETGNLYVLPHCYSSSRVLVFSTPTTDGQAQDDKERSSS